MRVVRYLQDRNSRYVLTYLLTVISYLLTVINKIPGVNVVPTRTLVLSPAYRMLLPIINRLGFNIILSRGDGSSLSQVLTPHKAAEIWIDVGAHIGDSTLQTASLNSERLVYAFEPNIKTIAYASGLLGTYIVIPMAVTERDGFVTLHINNQSETSSTLPLNEEGLKRWRSKKPIREESEIICPTIRLDTFMHLMDISSIEFLKIDAQGADLSVVRSAGERLKDIKEILLEVQVSDIPVYQGASTKDSVLEFMRDNGFALVDKTSQSFGQEEDLRFKRV